MDDEQPNNQATPPQSPDDQGVNIPVTGASSSPTPVNEPSAITPPTPGQVVSAGPARPPAVPTVSAMPTPESNNTAPVGPVAPSAQVVTSHHGGGKKRWLKVILLIIIIGLLAAGGWLAYQKHHKVKAPAVSQSKTVPLLKIGILQVDYGNLYPDMSVSSYAFLTNSQMFEGLVRYEGKNKIVPDLASTWTNPDDKTWLFTITPDVKFHDGHTMTAQDVKYSIDTIIASNSDFAQTFASTIASTEVVGTNQVKITTKEPDPVLLNRLAFLYVIDANLPKDAEASQAGTGPYEIKPGTKPTADRVQMVAFNDYHGGRPQTQALDFGNEATTEDLVKAFKQHKFNIVGPIPANDAKNVAGATEYISSESDVNYIGFNTVKPGPLQNKLVREAIRYAVNPTAIGQAAASQVAPISQMIPETIPGYNPSITPYKQNIAKAKQLLAQAGYPNGLSLRLSTAGDPKATDEMVKDLKQAGITVNVDRHNDFDEFIDYFTGGQSEMFTVDFTSDTLDGLDIYTSSVNSANYANPKFTGLLSQISATTDPAKRLKLLQEASVIIDQDVALVPLYTQNSIWLTDKPYAIQQDMPSSFISVYFYKVHQK